MAFKFSFTRTQTTKPTGPQVRELVKKHLRALDKDLRTLQRSAPFSIALEAEVEVKPQR